MRLPTRAFTAVPFSPTIGAELSGVDLRQPVDEELFEELHRALLEWKVLFFRDQELSSEQHVRFSRLWGELEVHPFLAQGDVPEIVRFAKDDKTKAVENVWHSDVSFREAPSMGSVLRALEVPPIGGDTIWVDMAAAYDGLPDDVKDRIDGMVAVHDFALSYGLAMSGEELAKGAPGTSARPSPDRADPSRDQSEDPLRERDLHKPHRGTGAR